MAGILTSLSSLLDLGGKVQLGIDIGAAAVKIIAIKGSNENDYKIVGAAYEETPPGCVTDGVLGDPRSMVEVVKRAIEKAGIRNYRGMPASVGLRGVGVMFRRLMLPYQNPDEMGAQVVLEAQQQIESDLSEWIVDYQVISPPDRQGQCSVMLVGAKKNVAEDYITLLRMVGVQPQVFDCDIFAIANSLEHALGGSVPDTVLILDIGRDTTKFHLVQDNIPVIVRSFPSGGLHLTEMLAKNMAMDFEQAEVMKVSAANSEGAHVPKECENAFSAYIKELTGEIKQTIEFFANSNSDTKIDAIDRIYLCGGGAATRGLIENLSTQFNTKVEFLDPFRRAIPNHRAEEGIAGNPHIFSVAFGLAMRRAGDKEQ